eukprot:2327668-Alexandrium_andersonii.AAC.1
MRVTKWPNVRAEVAALRRSSKSQRIRCTPWSLGCKSGGQAFARPLQSGKHLPARSPAQEP